MKGSFRIDSVLVIQEHEACLLFTTGKCSLLGDCLIVASFQSVPRSVSLLRMSITTNLTQSGSSVTIVHSLEMIFLEKLAAELE